MEPRTNSGVSCAACFSRLTIGSPRLTSHCELLASGGIRALQWTLTASLALLALAFMPAHLAAQQGYPASPYDYSSPYMSPYAQPTPRYGYAQPQYAQPQYQQPDYAPQQPYAQQPYPQQSYPDQQYAASPYPEQQDLAQQAAPVQPLSEQDLEQLLAPIALYPDALLAQILAASTYPAQVAVADQWLHSMQAQGYGSPDQIAAGAQVQTNWDPSVKALTAFPDVLDMLNHNLEWTTNLGNAYYNQPQDVMQTVQVLRQRAEQAGNLESTPQEDVNNDQGYIQLAPANPQVVYVPTYDPWDVYGQPISPYPGFSLIGALGSFFGGAPIQYGLGFAMAAFEHTPFGLMAWGFDWLAHAILFDHGNYYSHSTTVADWGLPHGGPHAYAGNWGGNRMRDGPYGANRSWNGQRWNGQQARGQQARGQQARGQQAYNQHDNYQRSYGQRGYDQRGNAYSSPARPGNFERPAIGVPYSAQRSEQFNRGYQQPAYGYTHPALSAQTSERATPQQYERAALQQNYGYRTQTYPNRPQAYAGQSYASRPQTFSNPGYGYSYSNRAYSGNAYSRQGYAARSNYAYSNPYQSYRAPQSNSSRAFSGRSYEGYGNSIARNERSGGFHPFGGGKEPKGFGSERAPKFSYKAPRGFSGGHEKAPKMSRSGGGGHHHFH